MSIPHSVACEEFLTAWRAQPPDAFPHKLADFVADHTDSEVIRELITYLDEDPADFEPVVYARLLWPTLTPVVAEDVAITALRATYLAVEWNQHRGEIVGVEPLSRRERHAPERAARDLGLVEGEPTGLGQRTWSGAYAGVPVRVLGEVPA